MPTSAGDGTIVEPSGAQYSGYARVVLTANHTSFPAPAGGSISNGVTITFPTSGGGISSPVTLTHVAALNHASGRLIGVATLPPGTVVNNGDTPSFTAGQLVFSCGPLS
jgi:hypothetical protein